MLKQADAGEPFGSLIAKVTMREEERADTKETIWARSESQHRTETRNEISLNDHCTEENKLLRTGYTGRGKISLQSRFCIIHVKAMVKRRHEEAPRVWVWSCASTHFFATRWRLFVSNWTVYNSTVNKREMSHTFEYVVLIN
jgi:hypothetical protein